MKVDAILWPHGFHPVSSQSFETVEPFRLDEAEVVSSKGITQFCKILTSFLESGHRTGDTLLLLLLEKEGKLSSALDRKHLRSRFSSQCSPLPSKH